MLLTTLSIGVPTFRWPKARLFSPAGGRGGDARNEREERHHDFKGNTRADTGRSQPNYGPCFRLLLKQAVCGEYQARYAQFLWLLEPFPNNNIRNRSTFHTW